MHTRTSLSARHRFARVIRRGLALAAVAATLATVGVPALSTLAASCESLPVDGDFDGLSCYQELIYGTDPFNADTDYDGLVDYNEIFLHGTDPLNPDTDFDGLADGVEWLYPSNPLFPDTDGDGVSDGVEFQAGTDLLNPARFPVNLIG